MAASDTARLIASLEWRDTISAGLDKVEGKLDQFGELVEVEIAEKFDDALNVALDVTDGISTAFSDATEKVGDAVGEARDTIVDTFEDVAEKVEDTAEGIPDKFRNIGPRVRTAFGLGLSGLAGIFSESFSEVRDIAQDQLKGAIKDGLEAVGVDPELASSIGRNIGQLAGSIGDTLSQKAGEVLSGSLAPRLLAAISSSPLVAALAPVFAGLGTALGAIMDAAIAAAPLLLPALLIAAIGVAIVAVVNDPSLPGKALDIGVGIVRGILEGLVGLGQKLVGFIGDVLGKLWQTGILIQQGIADFASHIPGAIVDGLVGLGGLLATEIGNTFRNLWNGAVGLAQAVIDFGGKIVTGIIDGLAGLPGKLVDAITSAFRAIEIDVGPFHISGTSGITIDMPTIDVGDFHSGSAGGRGSTFTGIPSNAQGLAFVPWNDYLTFLHRGEAVLPAREAAMWRDRRDPDINITVTPASVSVSARDVVGGPTEHRRYGPTPHEAGSR